MAGTKTVDTGACTLQAPCISPSWLVCTGSYTFFVGRGFPVMCFTLGSSVYKAPILICTWRIFFSLKDGHQVLLSLPV